MESRSRAYLCASAVVCLVLGVISRPVLGGDIVHHDDVAPKRPGCDNNFVLVKVPTWVDGVENIEYVGVGARFGPTLESKEKHANQTRVVVSDPPDCCNMPRNKLKGEVLLVHRGNCSFTTKSYIAERAGATAVLIINDQKELFKMVCEANETNISIKIPAVMLPLDAGESLEKLITNSTVLVQLYSPRRPVVDVAEVFLWLMAVGTILCASYWSVYSAKEASIEQEKSLKDGFDDLVQTEGAGSTGFVEINTMSAILFVVVASCFLIMLYKLMSYWFIEVLVVLFCIGGIEGLQTCLVALLSCVRWFGLAGQSFIVLPLFGAVSYLTLAVSPFCIAFAVLWAIYRTVSFAWIGQDILVWLMFIYLLHFPSVCPCIFQVSCVGLSNISY